MYNDNVFQQIAALISGQTYYLGWMVFFLLIIAVAAIFKGNGTRDALAQLRADQEKLHTQQAQLLHHLGQLQTIATASYTAQYLTAKSLELRSAAAATKRGESEPSALAIITPDDLQRQLAPVADPQPPTDAPRPTPAFVNPFAR